ncbi:MAG: GDSL family lipase [Lachnospiraceae bacterium]|nr:GDSL family lipase [Lachnospiraceae bacterium]
MSSETLKNYPLPELEYYKIYGRTDESQYPLPLFFNGSGIEVNVTGSELWIDVEVDYDVYEPWIFTKLNDAFMSRQMLTKGSHSICLFRGMSPSEVKNMKFFRELQAMDGDKNCRLLVKGFRSDGFFLPVSEKRYKLEFLGDSLTSGEGTYGAVGDNDWLPMYMSFSHDYTSMVADALDADFRIISHGGWGVLCGWDNDPRHNIPSCYEKICGISKGEVFESLGADKPYRFRDWKPDAIIVNLGTNDDAAFKQPPFTVPGTGETFGLRSNPDSSYNENDLELFKQAVIDFLFMLRRNNPDSHIVWAYGMYEYTLTFPITDAMNRYRKMSGDTNVAFLQLQDTPADAMGARSHPGVKMHEQAAKKISEYLRKRLDA